MKHKTVFKNNEEEPKPFYVHTGAAGVGKSFLINAVAEYVKRNFRYHGHKLEKRSIIVTVSTVNATSLVNGLTLHSVFHLQINENNSNA